MIRHGTEAFLSVRRPPPDGVRAAHSRPEKTVKKHITKRNERIPVRSDHTVSHAPDIADG